MTGWDDQSHKPDISTLNEPKTNSAPESRLCPHQLPLPSCGAFFSNPVLRSLFPKHNFITCVVANPPIRSVWLCRYVFILYFIASALLFAISYKKKEPKILIESRVFLVVEHSGFEPLTSSMRTMRATNCANAPYAKSIIPQRAAKSKKKIQAAATFLL